MTLTFWEIMFLLDSTDWTTSFIIPLVGPRAMDKLIQEANSLAQSDEEREALNELVQNLKDRIRNEVDLEEEDPDYEDEEEDPPYEPVKLVRCGKCQGNGAYYRKGRRITCDRCDGEGKVTV